MLDGSPPRDRYSRRALFGSGFGQASHSADSALTELWAPVRTATGRRRRRDAMPDRAETYGGHCESGLPLRADYVLVLARRP